MLRKVFTIVCLVSAAFLIFLVVKALDSQGMEARDGLIIAPPDTGTTIAFGSCNREDEPQDFWPLIARNEPEAWLWLGDNIYADTDDMDQMAAAYESLTENSQYATFVESVGTLYGTWDDHDYGSNDAGREWGKKEEAKTLMLDFLGVPAGAAVRQREGVYQAYRVGEVKVILLDTRYFRDELREPIRDGDRYGPNPDGDILGRAQWNWLRSELTDSDASAHLIVSSIQVLPTDHGYEKWALFPESRERLLQLIAETRPALPLLLSGDRHLGEFSVQEVDGFQVYEMTSSGLTHSYTGATEANGKRVGPLVTNRNFGILHYIDTPSGLRLLAEIHSVEDNAVLASLALPADSTNKAELQQLVYPNTSMTRQLKPCPESPNCVSTQSTQPKKKRDPISFTGSVEQAREKLKRIVSDMSRTKLLEEDANYLHYTFETWPIPYIDDVEFLIDDEAKLIHYRSASRVGHSDLGVNSRRMKKVVAAFAGE